MENLRLNHDRLMVLFYEAIEQIRDLDSCQPICELIRSKGANFIFTCLPSSHLELYK